MSQPDTGTDETEDQDTDKDTLALADPDDYHRSQRLKEIHHARQNVHDTLNEIDRYAVPSDHERQQLQLADAVSLYVQELLPAAEDAGLDTTIPDKVPWDDLQEYAALLGHPKDAEVSYQQHNMVFQRCNRVLAELKPLIEDDSTDEWEV